MKKLEILGRAGGTRRECGFLLCCNKQVDHIHTVDLCKSDPTRLTHTTSPLPHSGKFINSVLIWMLLLPPPIAIPGPYIPYPNPLLDPFTSWAFYYGNSFSSPAPFQTFRGFKCIIKSLYTILLFLPFPQTINLMQILISRIILITLQSLISFLKFNVQNQTQCF